MMRPRRAVGALALLASLQITSLQSPAELPAGSARAPRSCGDYALRHGRARPTGALRAPGSFALACDPGYVLRGPGEDTVRCRPDGSFARGKECRPISCGALAEPGGIADPPGEVFYPNAAKLSCGRGYVLSQGRSADRRCLSSGRFSDGARCEPAERWTAANMAHARADRLADLELLIDGQNFIAGAYYECHLTRVGGLETCARISTLVIPPPCLTARTSGHMWRCQESGLTPAARVRNSNDHAGHDRI